MRKLNIKHHQLERFYACSDLSSNKIQRWNNVGWALGNLSRTHLAAACEIIVGASHSKLSAYLQDWPMLFMTVPDKSNIADLSWLPSMWTDHLPEVRWSSLAIAAHIIAQQRSPLAIKQSIPGGMWNLAVIILLDSKECCLIRDQVGIHNIVIKILTQVFRHYCKFKSIARHFYAIYTHTLAVEFNNCSQ